MFLLIFIYVLLGMELFSQNDRVAIPDENGKINIPRHNFDTFFSGFIIVFTILTEENWDSNMISFAHTLEPS